MIVHSAWPHEHEKIRRDFVAAFEHGLQRQRPLPPWRVEYVPPPPPTWRQRVAGWLRDLAFRLDPEGEEF